MRNICQGYPIPILNVKKELEVTLGVENYEMI